MYFVCTVQPRLAPSEEATYIGPWMTHDEKRAAVDAFYAKGKRIPLSVAHTAAKVYGAEIPRDKVAGRIRELFIDRDGCLMAKGKISRKNSEAYDRIYRGITQEKEKWGVSPRIDWSMPQGLAGPINKELTHLAFTLTPLMKEYNTFIHEWSDNEAAIDRVIGQRYCKLGSCEAADLSYAGGTLLQRLSGKMIMPLFLFHSSPLSRLSSRVLTHTQGQS